MKLRATLVIAVVVFSMLASATSAFADGTETLGAPSIPIAEGSGMAIGGTGTMTQPASMSVTVPANATVEQVLLYWEGESFRENLAGDAEILVNEQAVTGTKIGGETPFFVGGGADYVHHVAYRADITALDIVTDGGADAATTELTVQGLDFSYANDSAGVVVIYDDGSGLNEIQLRDGLDLTYAGFEEPLRTTVPQTYTFEAAPENRAATFSLFAASVSTDRPNAVDITLDVAGTTTVVNPFTNSSGNEWDAIEIPVDIPAGATSITVQAVSRDDGTGRQPASLAWVGSFLSMPKAQEEEPPPPPEFCPKPMEWWKKQIWMKLLGKHTKFEGSSYSYNDVANATSKDPYWNLASEFVALELNRHWGADTSVVSDERGEAKQLLGEYLKKRHKVTGGVADEFNELADLLEDFNKSKLTPGCDVWDGHDGKDDDHDGGWGDKDDDHNGGWGDKDDDHNGGWGDKDDDHNGGWGDKDDDHNGGWGDKDDDHNGGWGDKDDDHNGGWGDKDDDHNGGWGDKDDDHNGGWGDKDDDDRDGKGGWNDKDDDDRDGKGGWNDKDDDDRDGKGGWNDKDDDDRDGKGGWNDKDDDDRDGKGGWSGWNWRR